MSTTRAEQTTFRGSSTRADSIRQGRENRIPRATRLQIRHRFRFSDARSFDELRSKSEEAYNDLVSQINEALLFLTRFTDEDGKLLPEAASQDFLDEYGL